MNNIQWETGIPDKGTIVLAVIQHYITKTKRYAVLISTNEDDQSWRTIDDLSELSYDFNVIKWIQLPMLDKMYKPKMWNELFKEE